jgi:hypothetical protein
VKRQLPGSRGGINGTVTDRSEPDTSLTKYFDQIDQVPKASTQPIQPPDQQGVPRLQRLKALLQTRSGCLRTADLIREQIRFGDARLFQSVELKLEFLTIGADAGIADQPGFAVFAHVSQYMSGTSKRAHEKRDGFLMLESSANPPRRMQTEGA